MMHNPRPYRSPADLDAMRAILSAGRLANNGTYYVHHGDLNWWWYYHDPDGKLPAHAYLWEQDGKTIGFALTADGNADVYFLPELRGTAEAARMYTWAETQTTNDLPEGDRKIRFYWVREDDPVLVNHLAGRGLAPGERHLVHHSLNLEVLPDAPDPGAYTIRGMTAADNASRARASKAAFETKKDWEPYLENYIRFTQAPAYDPEMDVVAVSPEGEIAAFTVCWVDPVSKTGLFEPVGTHPDHQRRGLGRAVMREGMRRMRARGARTAEVSTDDDNTAALALYGSLGFQVDGKLLIYEKTIQGPAA